MRKGIKHAGKGTSHIGETWLVPRSGHPLLRAGENGQLRREKGNGEGRGERPPKKKALPTWQTLPYRERGTLAGEKGRRESRQERRKALTNPGGPPKQIAKNETS